jgi:hypothetical protein
VGGGTAGRNQGKRGTCGSAELAVASAGLNVSGPQFRPRSQPQR